MRPVWILALAASGCRGILGIGEAVVIVEDAAPVPDVAEVCVGWPATGIVACDYPASPPLVLAGGAYTYDTRAGGGTLSGPTGEVRTSAFTLRPPDGPEVAVLSIEALTIGAEATISVIGPKPLLVLSWSTITIDGTLDASSRRQRAQLGAAANVGCTAMAGAPGTSGVSVVSGGSGGGGGGGFQGVGGLAGDGGVVVVGGGEGGGSAPATLRGGCPGGASGMAGPGADAPSGSLALGGAGGGARRLVARDRITVGGTGTVSANGAGGAGGPLRSACGGGGGGAGGYLGFEAAVVTLDGRVSANGGGGGGAAGPGDAGNDGADGAPGSDAAAGGVPTACGSAGGSGSDVTNLDGRAGTSFATDQDCMTTGGGGGGGGAAGFIVVASPAFTSSASAVISPPALRP